MKNLKSNSDKTRAWALTSASALVLGVAGIPFAPSMAFAQDEVEDAAEDDDDDAIVVTGVRRALQSAQDIKRNADTIVDSITATDIGAFPDKSVAEALQRVAGITVNRFAASDDTAHFSAEPSGVIVRGLNQVRNEFNGRDTFSANSSRGLSWGDVSPELMGGVDTYKNQMAELIEGGIAGTVNLRTRLPFDQNDQLFALSGNVNYGDLSDKVTPEFSGLYSTRWETEVGEFGLLANFAYSEVTTRTEGAQLYRMNRYRGQFDLDGDGAVDPDGLAYIPAAVNIRDNIYARDRQGVSVAGQWRNHEDTLLATVQYNRSEYNNAWEEYIVQTLPADQSYGESVFFEVPATDADGNPTAPAPMPGTAPFTFDETGLFQTGVLSNYIGWWGNNDAESENYAYNPELGMQMVNACYGWNGCEPNRRGSDMNTVTRSNNNENMTQDFSVNLKITPNDRLRVNLDAQFIESTVSNYDIELAMNSFANATIDLTGEYPQLGLSDPTNVNLAPGGFANPTNYYYRHIMDHTEDSEGTETALRADAEYDIDSGWLRSIKVGARWAERDQDVRWSGYNWQNVANVWTQDAQYFNVNRGPGSPCASDPSIAGCNGQAFTGYPTDVWQVREFGGEHFAGLTPNEFLFFDMSLLQDQELFASMFSAEALGFSGGVGWDPICSNMGDRADEIPGTCYTPSETIDLTETTTAAYAQLNFGGDEAELFGFPVSGNLGVRWVRTKDTSTGGISYPLLSQEYFVDPNGPRDVSNLDCEPNVSNTPGVTPNPPGTIECYITQDIIDFANGFDAIGTATNEFDRWLPSFNIKFDLSDEWLVRFAASRAMSRPDIGNLRNYVGVGLQLPDQNNSADSLWVTDGSGTIVGLNARYNASAQNPFLEPVMANQFDISVERYFADVGQFSLAVFYKEFEDYIQFGTYYRELTNNGITNEIEVRGPLNGDGASIQGFEVAYQRFFDFLPAPWDGLGVQANYTYIDNQGISNTSVRNTGGEGTTITSQSPDAIEVDRLEGLSDHAYNLVGMYEKGPLALRMAYSWRSEYLQTAIDCCVAYAIWTEDQGFLDGSIRYRLNDNFELSLQGSNLLNTDTVLEQQVTNASDGGLRQPNAWFQNDRRFTVGLRFKY